MNRETAVTSPLTPWSPHARRELWTFAGCTLDCILNFKLSSFAAIYFITHAVTSRRARCDRVFFHTPYAAACRQAPRVVAAHTSIHTPGYRAYTSRNISPIYSPTPDLPPRGTPKHPILPDIYRCSPRRTSSRRTSPRRASLSSGVISASQAHTLTPAQP